MLAGRGAPTGAAGGRQPEQLAAGAPHPAVSGAPVVRARQPGVLHPHHGRGRAPAGAGQSVGAAASPDGGLVDARSGRTVDPPALVSDEKIEMTPR